MTDIAVIDYGMGNLHSVSTRLRQVAPTLEVTVTGDPAIVARAARVVFPGQGAMPDCMRELDAHGLRAAVLEAAHTKPFLGICIGLQMLFGASEEGDVACLGVMPGRVRRFADAMVTPAGERVKVPHMGWNRVRQAAAHPLWRGVADQAYFYFVHSYYVDTPEPSLIAGSSDYPQPFTCAVARDNVFAVQFHPEKSGADGVQLLTNFVQWQPASWLARPRQLVSAN
ncbi:MAG TPA: imidazole glycerol phosphate synthase subunit HisH [Burkholderiales bacterium]|jgi:glutamine amidotransferase|nr:imidazole glycerol phosphate synthase subunit HisH [Burkholderiales bacterium]